MKRTLTIAIVIVMMAVMLTGCVVATPHNITFDSMGGSSVASIEGKVGDIVKAPQAPTREGHDFMGWYADKEYNVKYIFSVMDDEDITLYAKWEQYIFSITYVGNGGTGTSVTSYSSKEDTVLPTDWLREGYRFAGWYDDAEFSGNVIGTIPTGTVGDKTLYAKWLEREPGKAIVTLNGNGGAGTDLDSYKEGVGATLPNDWTREGYDFVGWYDNAKLIGSAITNISTSAKGDKVYYAKWTPKKYDVIFHVGGGNAMANKQIAYDTDIVVPDATMDGKLFAGWYTDEACTAKFVATKMPAHDVNLYAKWVDAYKVDYYSNGTLVQSVNMTGGNLKPIDPVGYDFYEPDYYFDGWYKDTTWTSKYGDSVTIKSDTKLYAHWISRSFLPYESKFKTGGTASNPIKINNDRELIALVDYAMFKGSVNTIFKLTYTNDYNVTKQKVDDALGEWATNATLGKVSYSVAKDNSYAEITVPKENYRDGFKTLNGQVAIPKMHNALVPVAPNTRSDAFDNFKYKNYTETLNVETSNQLFYALQHGIEPIVKAGSSADKMMKSAKEVLRDICDDSMSDFRKLYAIFCWINQHVTYDNVAASRAIKGVIEPNNYDSWHLEGVFRKDASGNYNGFAVCDAIAKAVTVMARIEGIPCVRIAGDIVQFDKNGNEVRSGHAWNKVYIDYDNNGVKEWYNLDATWGNGSVGDGTSAEAYDTNHIIGEAINSENFLFHDGYDVRENPRQGDNFQDIKAKTPTTDYFKYLDYEYNDSKNGLETFDLDIDKSEVSTLAKYVKDYATANHFAKGEYIVVNVKQSIAPDMDTVLTKMRDALDLADMVYTSISYIPAEYSARMLIKL